MKKIVSLFVLLLSLASLCANDFFTTLQFIAAYTAAKGTYSSTEAGYDTKDPPDYYTPKAYAKLFAEESGNQTKTTTFYGVCFNYAEVAWNLLFQRKYSTIAEWYIAYDSDNGTSLTLCDLSNSKDSTRVMNGVYIKDIKKMYAYPHDNATNHAWIVLKHKDGTWYWVDPTWTDNLGFPVFGYIKDGKEIQLMPESGYCMIPCPYKYQTYVPQAYNPKVIDLTNPAQQTPVQPPAPAPKPTPKPTPSNSQTNYPKKICGSICYMGPIASQKNFFNNNMLFGSDFVNNVLIKTPPFFE